ncbi:hypothetical protein WA026_005439 [Henosepilachna vigintioctopunctata]|uniref:Uncharacterized protein n=1 Tax=Henosepilachna vigintioctopunctata TaxID=420089 RepID=A0AAW1U1N9_9CUCU
MCPFLSEGNGISTNGDNTISSFQSTEFLEIYEYVDSNFGWTTHIDDLCEKLSNSFLAISRIVIIVPRNCVMNEYFSLVYSHLN